MSGAFHKTKARVSEIRDAGLNNADLARVSEEELRAELHCAGITNASDLAEGATRDIRAGKSPEVHMVENIVGFSPQLEREVFAKTHIPRQREIEARRARPIDNASSCGSESIRQASQAGARDGTVLFSASVIVTLAPAIAEPFESLTEPRRLPVTS
jgi:hypothetical protein